MKEDLEDKKENNKKKGIVIISIIIGVLGAILLLLSTIFAITNQKNDRIANGISIGNVIVEKLTKQEAIDLLNKEIETKRQKEICLRYGDYNTTIKADQIDLQYEIEAAVNQAYEIGRNKNIFLNNWEIIQSNLNKQNIEIGINYKMEELDNQIDDINSQLPGAMKQSDYYIEDSNLIITRGTEGIQIQKEKVREEILSRMRNIKAENSTMELLVETKIPEDIDIEKIYEEIHKEAENAYYTNNPFKVYPHVNGVDFAISLEEVKALLKEEKNEYCIPLKITKPQITTDKIGSEAFPDLLASFSTKYNARDTARTTNLKLASNKINGTVILPGETFSYNKVVGERTIAAGYKEAKIYSNGQVIDGLGGGICQISSTLYNAVLYANLDIVSRRNHQFVTSYLPAGRDATVVYGATDFKFKNSRNYPIKIKSYVNGGIAKVEVYGKKEETEYKVEIQANVTGTISNKTIYTDDPNIEAGKEIVKQKGHNGTRSETYKIISLNGKVISRTLLSKDTYNPMDRLVTRGTKTKQEIPPQAPIQPEEPVSPDPVVTPPTQEENNIENKIGNELE